ncbi:4650_t:CDS:1 [Acaulospora morrowiae]|uniref:4650_t:CDS:1 n=1 Tax=Acaulospora morrowiae TaxID=94023 RepID=A0A9N9HE10_9GLOM|nr:4650_t:CDS:1 [Acaulospora morrowiae]
MFQGDELSSQRNPILLDTNISHFQKIIILRCTQFNVKNNKLLDIVVFQNAWSDAFRNTNSAINHNGLIALYKAGLERTDYNIPNFARNLKKYKNPYSTQDLFDAAKDVDAYCDFISNGYNNVGTRWNQVHKIEQICDYLGITKKGSVDLMLDNILLGLRNGENSADKHNNAI